MGFDPVTVAIAGAVIAGVGTYQQMEAAKDAKSDREQAANAQRQAQSEQRASQAAQAAAARRQQIREERVKRARIMQSSTNTGVSASSGELGAVGGLNTQLGSNLGYQQGQINAAGRISAFNQTAADFLSSAENKMADASMWGGVAGLGMTVFNQAGGFKSLFGTQAPAPVETRIGQSK